jgi:biotin transport system ATP-binding protein
MHAAGTSVVIVTHDLRDVFHLADRVVVLQEGTVALDGTPDAVAQDLDALGVRPPAESSATQTNGRVEGETDPGRVDREAGPVRFDGADSPGQDTT